MMPKGFGGAMPRTTRRKSNQTKARDRAIKSAASKRSKARARGEGRSLDGTVMNGLGETFPWRDKPNHKKWTHQRIKDRIKKWLYDEGFDTPPGVGHLIDSLARAEFRMMLFAQAIDENPVEAMQKGLLGRHRAEEGCVRQHMLQLRAVDFNLPDKSAGKEPEDAYAEA